MSTIKLYANRECPYVQRVLIGIHLRNITPNQLDIEWIDFNNPPAGLVAINPDWTVPMMEQSPGTGFDDSLHILEYLDNIPGTGPKLMGATAFHCTQSRFLAHALCRGFLTPVKAVVYPFGHLTNQLIRSLDEGFYILNHWLEKLQTPFFGGHHLGYVDIALASFVAKYQVAQSLDARLPVPPGKAQTYMNSLFLHPVVQTYCGRDRVLSAMEKMFFTPKSIQDARNDSPFSESDFGIQIEKLNKQNSTLLQWQKFPTEIVGNLPAVRAGETAVFVQCLEALGHQLHVLFSITISQNGSLTLTIPLSGQKNAQHGDTPQPQQENQLREQKQQQKLTHRVVNFVSLAEEFLAQWPSFGSAHVSRFL